MGSETKTFPDLFPPTENLLPIVAEGYSYPTKTMQSLTPKTQETLLEKYAHLTA